jgi:hypothetical protein
MHGLDCILRLNTWSRDYQVNDKKIFRDSLVDNAMELTSLLTKLNVTNDPKLEDARKELEKSLVGVTPEDLRESPVLRQIVVDKVSQIMETI